jgi:large subunit ribosomal protein L9
MQVLLKEDVDNLGLAGEVHKVADGYGRNYLIPRRLAVVATPGALKQAEAWQERAANRRAELRAEYEILAEKISGVVLSFVVKAGSKGKLYGSITTAEITDRLNEKLGTELDKRKLEGEPLRHLGEYQLAVRLNSEFQPQFTVIVQTAEQVAEAAAAAAAAEAAEVEAPEVEAADVEADAPAIQPERETEDDVDETGATGAEPVEEIVA